MTSFADDATGTYAALMPPDLEPDDQWKANIRKNIEINIASMVKRAEQVFDDQRLDPSLNQAAIMDDYKHTMREILAMAEQHYQHALEKERQERLWAYHGSEAIREQQEILDSIQRDSRLQSRTRSASDAAVPSEERRRAPASTKVTQRRNTTIVDQGAQERVRKQFMTSNYAPEDPHLQRSVKDRETSRIVSFVTPHQNEKSIRDHSNIIGSPLKSKPEIWKPAIAFQEASTSMIIDGTSSIKRGRDSNASISPARSIGAITEYRGPRSNFPQNIEREQVRMHEPEHMQSGVALSRQWARTSSSGADECVSVNRLASDSLFVDEYSPSQATSVESSTSYDASGYQTAGVSAARLPTNLRRNSVEELHRLLSPANPRIWIPPSQAGETMSLRFRDAPIPIPPSEAYTGGDQFGSQSDSDYFERWQKEFLQRENLMEGEAERKGVELKQKEAAPSLKEEAQRKDEEYRRRLGELKRIEDVMWKEAAVRRKQEEVKQRELAFFEREAEVMKKRLEIQKKEEEIRKKQIEATRMAEEVGRQAEVARRKEQEYKRKEAEVKRVEDAIRKREAEALRKEEARRREEEEKMACEEEAKKGVEPAYGQGKETDNRQREIVMTSDEQLKRRMENLTLWEADVQSKERVMKKEEELKQREAALRLREVEVRTKEQRRKEEKEMLRGLDQATRR